MAATPLKLALVTSHAAAKHICYVRDWPLRNKQKPLSLFLNPLDKLQPSTVVNINAGGPVYDYCHAPFKWHDVIRIIRTIADKPLVLTVQSFITAYSAPGFQTLSELIESLPNNVQWECIPVTKGLFAAGQIPFDRSTQLFGPWSKTSLVELAKRAFDRDRVRGTSFFKTYPQCYPILQDELHLRSQTF